jgi:hypothetical protein
MCGACHAADVGDVPVYEITIGGDGLGERVARLPYPEEDHPPPCRVPWSLGSAGRPLVVAVCVDDTAAVADLADRMRPPPVVR